MRVRALVISLGCLGFFGGIAACGADEKTKVIEPSTDGVEPDKKPPTANPTVNLEASFDSLDAAIFQSRCVSCHSGAAPAARIDLSTYDSLRAARTFPALIKPLNATASLLFAVVENGSMPPGPAKLVATELTAMKVWIDAGARRKETDPVPAPVPAPTEPPD